MEREAGRSSEVSERQAETRASADRVRKTSVLSRGRERTVRRSLHLYSGTAKEIEAVSPSCRRGGELEAGQRCSPAAAVHETDR